MKIKKLLLALITVSALACCTNEEVYEPRYGGVTDTLHNEIHVTSLSVLNDPQYPGEKLAYKIYVTDDDGFKYSYDPATDTFVLAEKTDAIFYFYFDAAQTAIMTGEVVTGDDGKTTYPVQKDAPVYTLNWYKMKAIPVCPEEIDSEAEVRALGKIYGFEVSEDYEFVGWSLYPTCLGDKDHIWQFGNYYKEQQKAVTNLYGVWVEK